MTCPVCGGYHSPFVHCQTSEPAEPERSLSPADRRYDAAIEKFDGKQAAVMNKLHEVAEPSQAKTNAQRQKAWRLAHPDIAKERAAERRKRKHQ